MIRIVFPDRSSAEFEPGTTGLVIAQGISRSLAKRALACRFSGVLMDLTTPLPGDGSIEIVTFSDDDGKAVLRHSASHLMAAVVKRLYPGTRLGIGPAIADGFYYDFDIPDFPGSEALEVITAAMEEEVILDLPFVSSEVDYDEAVGIFEKFGESYKLELLGELREAGEKIRIYQHGNFFDLCKGPHVPSTGYLKHFRLLSIAGAYWRGNERNPMLTRIYGTVFDSSSALADHLALLEEARKRDHRKLGPELDLFTMGGAGGPGLTYWLPRGTVLREELEDYWKRAHRAAGYSLVVTPHIAPSELWDTSGHSSYYRENMFYMDVDSGEYVLKPMNCPGHIIIYQSSMRSYRELPLRLAELGAVYRYEKSGVLHGLMRVRGFTIDDGHIFCREDQIKSEIQDVVRFALHFLRIFGFGYEIELSLMDPDDPGHYAGDPEEWKLVEPALAESLDEMDERYRTVRGEAAFYGPKIDIKLRDALGRFWQGPTIQFDFNIPARFDLTYVGDDGQEHRVFMIHRALFGSVERFIGCLIEHYTGNFPGWLAPVQVVILPITSSQEEVARSVAENLSGVGLRVEMDSRSETIGYRIRCAEKMKVPFMLVVGEREAESGSVALRRHGEGDMGAVPLAEARELVLKECSVPLLP